MRTRTGQQFVVRVGQLDGNVDTPDNTATIVEVGLTSYVLKDSVKLQGAYAHSGYQTAGVGALNEGILAGQFKF